MDSPYLIPDQVLQDWLDSTVKALEVGKAMRFADSAHFDEIDSTWSLADNTLAAACLTFQSAARLLSPEWDGVLSLIAPLRGSSALHVGRPRFDRLRLHELEPPSLHLFTRDYYALVPRDFREEYRWVCDSDPWGVTDAQTRVMVVSGRIPSSRQSEVRDYYNDVRVIRYP
jgi:hypothetical protein